MIIYEEDMNMKSSKKLSEKVHKELNEGIDLNSKSKSKSKRRKIIGVTVESIAVIIIIAILGFSYYCGYQVAYGLLYQNEGLDTKGNSVKQLAEWNYDEEEYERANFEKKNNGNEFTVTAKDGNIIYGTHFIKDNKVDNNTVILIHGLGGDRVSMEPIAKMYLLQGWNVITYDQRASGESKNEWVTFGYFEKYDVEALVDYIKDLTTDKKIVIHGQSMGAVTAGLYAATKHASEHIYAVIMDSPFDSMESMFLGVWNEMEGTEEIPDDYIIWCGDWYLKWNYKFSFADADLVDLSKNNHVKSLVIESMRDNISLPEMNEEIYEAIATKDKELWRVDAEHIEGFVDYPEEYTKEVMEFLQK